MVKFNMLNLTYEEKNFKKIMVTSARTLKDRGIIAYPTESFYALGVLATDKDAVKRLYELKRRPAEKPLPVIVGDMDTLKSVVRTVPDAAKELMNRFWPGPLTIIFEAQNNVPDLLTGGSGKVAVRIPGESVALDLARSIRLPITATSANPSLMPPAQDSEAVKDYFEDKVDLIIDGGKAPGGRPSTIVDVTVLPPEVLREGSILLNA